MSKHPISFYFLLYPGKSTKKKKKKIKNKIKSQQSSLEPWTEDISSTFGQYFPGAIKEVAGQVLQLILLQGVGEFQTALAFVRKGHEVLRSILLPLQVAFKLLRNSSVRLHSVLPAALAVCIVWGMRWVFMSGVYWAFAQMFFCSSVCSLEILYIG